MGLICWRRIRWTFLLFSVSTEDTILYGLPLGHQYDCLLLSANKPLFLHQATLKKSSFPVQRVAKKGASRVAEIFVVLIK